MYKPKSLDQERASWKTVIYFNVVHSLQHILTTLETWGDTLDEDSLEDPTSSSADKSRANAQPSPASNSSSTASGHPGSAPRSSTTSSGDPGILQIANLREKLRTLVATDIPLADRLSGGITVSGSGKGGVYVRNGWQARTIENALGRLKPNYYEPELKKSREPFHDAGPDILVLDVGRMLKVAKDDIKELWSHDTVQGLMKRRKLKLDEWSEL